ncbi:unnamed protein product, partial [marine sediment metagenome]
EVYKEPDENKKGNKDASNNCPLQPHLNLRVFLQISFPGGHNLQELR